MGILFRKSFNFGPFRLNLSKSGIGWSFGTKGIRYTKTAKGNSYGTFGIPGTGVSYRKSFPQNDSSATVCSEAQKNTIDQTKKINNSFKEMTFKLKDEFGKLYSTNMEEISNAFQVTGIFAKYLLTILIKSSIEDNLPEQFLVKDIEVLGGVEIDRIYFEQLYNRQILNKKGWYYSLNINFINQKIDSLIDSKKTKEDKDFDAYLREIQEDEKKWRAEQCKNIKKEWWEE